MQHFSGQSDPSPNQLMNQSASTMQHHQYNQSQQPPTFDQQQPLHHQYAGQSTMSFDYQNQEMQSRLQKQQSAQHQASYNYQQMTEFADPN